MIRLHLVRIAADHEYNADAFWDQLAEHHPEIWEAFAGEPDSLVLVTPTEWNEIQRLPGFDRGPSYAKYALYQVGLTNMELPRC